MKKRLNNNQIFLISIGAISLLATILGALNSWQGNFSAHSWAFFPLGMFVWGDALVLGTFLTLGSLFLFYKKNVLLTILFFSAYATVRAFIEALYGLNAQFSTVYRPWEKTWLEIASSLNLSPLELYMLDQIIATCFAVTGLLVFIYFLKKYFKA